MRKVTDRRKRKALARRARKKGMKANKTGYTLDAAQIEDEILKGAGEHRNSIERVVNAGMKMLFSKETHNQLFDGIDRNLPIEDSLGSAAVGLMLVLIKESKGTMPGEAIIPSGAILLAKTIEYIHKTNMFPVTDETYSEALQMFITVIKRELEKMLAPQDGQQPDPQQGEQPVQQPMQQPPATPSGGMLQGA